MFLFESSIVLPSSGISLSRVTKLDVEHNVDQTHPVILLFFVLYELQNIDCLYQAEVVGYFELARA